MSSLTIDALRAIASRLAIPFLLILLAVGAFLRFDGVTKNSVWLDEFWALYLATGRGDAVFNAPIDQLIPPPPATFAGAPPWWHIWTGLNSTTHPPMYFFVLRAWVDVFGDSDLSARSLSAILSLAGAVLLYEIIRRQWGIWPAMLSAWLMIFAAMQIDYSQVIRPYTLIVFESLVCCAWLLSIENRGATAGRIIGLFLSVLILAMTHYLALGPILAMAIYALIQFRRRGQANGSAGASRRWYTVGAIALAGIIFVATWAPFYIRQGPAFALYAATLSHAAPTETDETSVISALIAAPRDLLLGTSGDWPIMTVLLAVLVYIVPVLRLRRSIKRDAPNPDLFWWIWMIGSCAVIAVVVPSYGMRRYAFLAIPAVAALCARPLGTKGQSKWSAVIAALPAALIALCTTWGGVQRFRSGAYPADDWRTLSAEIEQNAGPEDALVFEADPSAGGWEKFDYIVFAHYPQSSHRPIVLIDNPHDADLSNVLSSKERAWIITKNPSETANQLPTWHSGRLLTAPGAMRAVEMIR